MFQCWRGHRRIGRSVKILWNCTDTLETGSCCVALVMTFWACSPHFYVQFGLCLFVDALRSTLNCLERCDAPQGHLFSEAVCLLLVLGQLFLPLLHAAVGLLQSYHQLGVTVLQSKELSLQVYLTHRPEEGKKKDINTAVFRSREPAAHMTPVVNIYTWLNPIRQSVNISAWQPFFPECWVCCGLIWLFSAACLKKTKTKHNRVNHQSKE